MVMTKKTNRRIAREKTLQILYAFEMNGEGLSLITEGVIADLVADADKEFVRKLTSKVVANLAELENKVLERVDNWEMSRIAMIDRLLLRMGIAEILYFPDIPIKVTINETIDIAKEFSTPNSGKFINGILDAICIELKDKGTLNKTGRGLIDETVIKKPSKSANDK
jgi:N utilization substance protein B